MTRPNIILTSMQINVFHTYRHSTVQYLQTFTLIDISIVFIDISYLQNRVSTFNDFSLIFMMLIFYRHHRFLESEKTIVTDYDKILLVQKSGRNHGVLTPCRMYFHFYRPGFPVIMQPSFLGVFVKELQYHLQLKFRLFNIDKIYVQNTII